jgi:selenocysteine lyase/cysteine desulfurase
MDNHSPRQIAEALARKGIYVWDGNYYALAVTERLGVEDRGGMVRVGLVHYNTQDEIKRLGEALHELGSM